MTVQGRRRLRVLCKGGLLISLPLTGFVWAMPASSEVLAGAVVLTMFSIVLGFAAEMLASSNETEFRTLSAEIAIESARRTEELDQRAEKLRQNDRVAAMLTKQNNDLRAMLLSVQVDIQRRKGLAAGADTRVDGSEDLSRPSGNLAGVRAG